MVVRGLFSLTGLFVGGCLVVGGGGKAEQKAEQKAAEKGGGGKLKAKGKRKESGFRGSQSRFKTTEKMKISPRRAAPVGALCEKSPPIRPNLVVAPTGAARRCLGFAFALQTPLQFR